MDRDRVQTKYKINHPTAPVARRVASDPGWHAGWLKDDPSRVGGPASATRPATAEG